MNTSRLFPLVLAALAVILAACNGPTDPYTARAWADGVEKATQAAAYDRAQAATIQAGVLYDAGTATAGAFAFQQSATQAAAQATAQAAQQTQAAATLQAQGTATAEAWTIQTTGTASAALMQTQTAYPPLALQTQAAMNEIRRQDEAKERAARWAAFVAPIKAMAPTVLIFAAFVLLILGGVGAYRRLMPVIELRLRAVPRGPHDAPLVLFSLPGGRVLAWDADRNIGPGAIIAPTGAQLTGLAADPLLQARITTQDQGVDLVRGLPREPKEQKRARELAGILTQEPTPAPTPQPPAPALPAAAPWQALASWAGGPLPLGLSAGGLVLADPEANPHFMFAGTTGSGKTRAGLRPLAALALAAGWQVSVFDNSGLDFLPFRDHPNARLVRLPDPAQAIEYLQALYRLIRERQDALTAAGCSTWGRLPGAGPRVLAIFDEFSNLADALNNQDREGLWRAARMIAAEGRKAGVHLALALQDPSHRSIDLRIRRNMTPVSFRVRDADASRVILNAAGAETLPGGQFLAVLGLAMTHGVGFAPDDNELVQFLNTRPAPKLPPPAWLDLNTAGADLPQDAPGPGQPDRLHGCTIEQVRQVCEMEREGHSRTAIEAAVFGFVGGAAYRKVKAILDDPAAAGWAGLPPVPTTTTTTTGQKGEIIDL